MRTGTAISRELSAIRRQPSANDKGKGNQGFGRLIPFVILALVVGVAFSLFFAAGRSVSGPDTLVMPLDDTYIHFQYARMIADGQLFRYGPGEPYTSGATSLLYPFLLAVGIKLGFTGMNLSLWAVGIGLVCWVASTWLIYRIVVGLPSPSLSTETGPGGKVNTDVIGFLVAFAFALSGGLAFAFMSGMETGLMIFGVLLTLDSALRRRLPLTLFAASLVALTRPEGLIIAVGACAYLLHGTPTRRRVLLLIPILCGLIQPALNLILTGSATASGMQAKSYLYNMPFDVGTAISAITVSFVRFWFELLTGIDRDGVAYHVLLLGLLAFGSALYFVLKRTRRPEMLLILFWIAGIGGLISTLETGFWQFKRYQQPVYALLFVLSGWLIIEIGRRTRFAALIAAALIVFSIISLVPFVGYYRDNVNEVANLQIRMAWYVASITQPADRIAVHDIGVMAYVGDRPVYDVVGLVTPGAAPAWRSGPGAVYEAMAHSPQRPAYFAVYDTPHGLGYFRDTALFRETLQTFESTRPPHNVASASDRQIVTRIDWSTADCATQVAQEPTLRAVQGLTLIDTVNVGDPQSESTHRYAVSNAEAFPGFATELFENRTAGGAPGSCAALDGGRVVTGSESFQVKTTPGQPMVWVIRVHPRKTARLEWTMNGERSYTLLLQPGDLGGQWLEIVVPLPAMWNFMDSASLEFWVSGAYMPFRHWFYQGMITPDTTHTLPDFQAIFDPVATLLGREITVDPALKTIQIKTEWERNSKIYGQDAKIFVHLYKDSAQPPIAQYDSRPGGGAYPPANWLPGIFRESYTLPLPTEPGTYRLAIGMYNPLNGARYAVTKPDAAPNDIQDDRLFIGTITVP